MRLWPVFFFAGSAAFAATVEVRVVGNDAYRVLVGHPTGDWVVAGPSVENVTEADVFDGADVFTLTGGDLSLSSAWIFVVAWSDDTGTQGLLVEARVAGQPPILSGHRRANGSSVWTVYATGDDFDTPSGGPAPAAVRQQIGSAILGMGGPGSNRTYVGDNAHPYDPGVLAIGEGNESDSGWFPAVPGIDPGARWIWFDPDPSQTRDPFAGIGNVPRKEYLIFALGINELPGFTFSCGSVGECLAPPHVTMDSMPDGSFTASGFGNDLSDWVAVGVRQGLSWSGRMEPTPLPAGHRLLHRARGISDGESNETLGMLLLEGQGGRVSARPDFRSLLSTDVRVVILDGDRVVLDRPGLEFPPITAPEETSPPEVLPQVGAVIAGKGDPVPDVDVVLEQIPGGSVKPGGVEFSDYYQEGLGGLEGPIVAAPVFDLLLGVRADIRLDGKTYRGDRIRFLMEPTAGSRSVETLETVEIRTTLPTLAWTGHAADPGVVFSGLPLAPLGDGEIAAGVLEGVGPLAFLSGLGPSGDDGALFDLGEAASFGLDWDPEDLEVGPVGSHAEVIGVVESEGGLAVSGGVRVAKGPGAFDQELFLRTPPGATQAAVHVDGEEVASVALEEGYVKIAATQEPPMRMGIAVSEEDVMVALSATAETGGIGARAAAEDGLSFGAAWDEPVSIAVEGGPGLIGREVVLVTDADAPTALAGAGVRGKDLPGLHLGAASAGSLDDSPPEPPAGAWLETPEIPGFRFKVRVSGGGGVIGTRQEADCIPETLCISGAIPGRSELFLRIVGPKPNGFLWPNIVKFSTSRIEVWIERTSTGATAYYLLEGASPGSSDLTGLFDREGFPAAAETTGSVGAGVPAWRARAVPEPAHAERVLAPKASNTDPPGGPWLQTAAIPGFRFKVRVTGGSGVIGTRQEADCIPETLCISGAIPGRSELFLRIVGPKPNGFLWPNIVKFSTSRIEVWAEQLSSGDRNYYLLEGASPGSSELVGFFDRNGFRP